MDYVKQHELTYSMMGTDGNLSVVGAFQLIQDAVTGLLGSHGLDGYTVKREFNALWVFVRTRAEFYNTMTWNEGYTVTAFFSHISVARMEIDVHITNVDGADIIRARTELCILDIEKQRIRRLSSVGVDSSMLSSRHALDICFAEFDNAELSHFGTVAVQSTNIDFSHHTNNLEYVRLIMNTYSVEQTENMHIKEMELVYCGQSFENDELEIRKSVKGGRHLITLWKGSPVIKCEIICETP